MSEPWMPSDEEIERVRALLDIGALRALIRAAVEKALAEERARHAREQTEFIGAALHEFGVSGDDAQPGELPGNYLLRLIRESKASHAREIKKARRVAGLAESLADEFDKAVASRSPTRGMSVSVTGDFVAAAQLPSVFRRMGWWSREIRAALAAMEEGK